MNDKMIQRYIEELSRFQPEDRNELDETQLREIAIELGFSAEDLDQIQSHSKNVSQRAEGFMSHRLWNDAIEQWNIATALSPNNNDYAMRLAECYTRRGNPGDADLALSLANESIKKNPSLGSAYEIIAKTDHNVNSYTHDKSFRYIAIRQIAVAGLVMVLSVASAITVGGLLPGLTALIASIFFFYMLVSERRVWSKHKRAMTPMEETGLITKDLIAEDAIPIHFDVPENFEVTTHLNQRSYLVWAGTVTHNADYAIAALIGTATFHYSNGKATAKKITAFKETDQVHRRGYQRGFTLSADDSESITHITIKLSEHGKCRPQPCTIQPFDIPFNHFGTLDANLDFTLELLRYEWPMVRVHNRGGAFFRNIVFDFEIGLNGNVHSSQEVTFWHIGPGCTDTRSLFQLRQPSEITGASLLSYDLM